MVVNLVPLIALALVLLDAVADVLPDTAVLGIVTPVRVVIAVGLLTAAPQLLGPRPRAGLGTERDAGRDGGRAGGPRGGEARWWWPVHLCMLLLLAAAAVPAHTYAAWAQWRGLVTCVAVAYLAAAVMRGAARSWPAITFVATVSVATAGLAGIRQTVQGIPTGFCRGAIDGTADSCGHAGTLVRAAGTFGNPNLLAAFLLLMTPLAAGLAATSMHRESRAVAWLIAAVGIGGVLATGSRAGVLGLVAMVCAYVVLRRPTTGRLVGGVVAVVAVLAAGAVALLMGAGLGVRTDVWRAALHLVPQNPLGVGWGRTGDLIAAAVPGNEAFQHSHNLWLDALLATGAAGFLAMLGLTVLAAWAVVRAARRGSAAGVALGAALAGFAVYCLVDDPINAIRNAYAAWAVVGLALAAPDAAVEDIDPTRPARAGEAEWTTDVAADRAVRDAGPVPVTVADRDAVPVADREAGLVADRDAVLVIDRQAVLAASPTADAAQPGPAVPDHEGAVLATPAAVPAGGALGGHPDLIPTTGVRTPGPHPRRHPEGGIERSVAKARRVVDERGL